MFSRYKNALKKHSPKVKQKNGFRKPAAVHLCRVAGTTYM